MTETSVCITVNMEEESELWHIQILRGLEGLLKKGRIKTRLQLQRFNDQRGVLQNQGAECGRKAELLSRGA